MNQPYKLLLLALTPLAFFSCTSEPLEKTDQNAELPVNTISYASVNAELVSFSSTTLVLDDASNASLVFSISALSGSNVATTVSGANCEILDNQGLGYPDALKKGDDITASGKWQNKQSVLGNTVSHSGKFEGAGNRYLGFRFSNTSGNFFYGWVQLNCSGGNGKLQVIDFAYNKTPDQSIIAGQKDSNETIQTDTGAPATITGPQDIIGKYRETQDPASSYCNIIITASADPAFDFEVQFFPFMWPWPKLPGKISNGKLIIPMKTWEGNIPSPGGNDRLYAGQLSGEGEVLQQQGLYIVWQIDYNKTGFMSEAFNGEFVMYKCD
ncbi:MAG: hypothetical protein IPK76_24240 [Lewinellaceae bacterium]|nr:hypothetical protein [Lewinellaceae bacterium]